MRINEIEHNNQVTGNMLLVTIRK